MKRVTGRKPIYIVALLLTGLSSACNEATFTGNNPSRAQDEATADVFCEFTQSELNVGEKTTLNIRFQGERPASVFQTTTYNDVVEDKELVPSDGEIAPEEFTGDTAGKLEVALRLNKSDAEPVATCTAQIKAVAVPVEQSLACSLSPNPIELGSSAKLQINTSGITGPLFQTATVNGQPLGEVIEVSSDETNPQTLTPTAEGTLKVELRLAPEGEVQATCEAAVITTEVCEDTEESIGAHIAFLIDNSNSNAATDCPESTKIGKHKNVDLYECGAKTNREKAVEAAYGLLQSIREKESENMDALSEMAVVSFPTKDNFIDGFGRETKWLAVESNQKDTLTTAMEFTRRPYGLTPYGAAFTGATELFNGLEDSEKARVAVLVTDGEPTDQDPEGVFAQAKALRDQGVEVITVFVTGKETREARRANHTEMMQGIDASSIRAGEGPWYSDAYANFAAYSASLTGNRDTQGLVERVSSEIVEVENSEALTAVFQSIIKTRAIRCEDR